MSEKKTDRRTLKTRKAICDAFAELLANKELHKITVQEIADRADVNRVTFYKHYLDVYDLYDKIEEDVLVELGLLILQLDELRSEEFFSCLIGYIRDNKSVFGMIFSRNGTNDLREKFGKLMEGLFRKLISEQKDSRLNDGHIEYLSCYRAQGCIAVVEKWVLGGLSEPESFIVGILSDLDKNTENFIMKN
ncbi:transcriptional regulator, TetR family [Ruminococcus sp. YRD2003]|uniref:TetR/AcrR family transcriptional regulator n=1 Tax=Ruminococcus sp. YRD2003 TaxID=1452313 RepID=UPI0008AFD4C2|nr:transcriptional regulator, TetR family [Ruminococcus flavefaciens]